MRIVRLITAISLFSLGIPARADDNRQGEQNKSENEEHEKSENQEHKKSKNEEHKKSENEEHKKSDKGDQNKPQKKKAKHSHKDQKDQKDQKATDNVQKLVETCWNDPASPVLPAGQASVSAAEKSGTK